MPELPEVETTMNGIRPYLEGRCINEIVVRERQLRWPVPDSLEASVRRQKILKLERRGKYILIHFVKGGLIVHLGMSGSMRVLRNPEQPGKHDHFDIVSETSEIIRFRDPRKFGCLLFSSSNLYNHPRLQSLGVEPLTSDFHGALLYDLSRNRKTPVKTFIMDGTVVVGVGNIYVSEALFDCGIHPVRKCSRIALSRYASLVASIRLILQNAIDKGGTTLQDFVGVEGKPGYFEQELTVYGRENKPCIKCRTKIRRVMIAQRSTYYCPHCQK